VNSRRFTHTTRIAGLAALGLAAGLALSACGPGTSSTASTATSTAATSTTAPPASASAATSAPAATTAPATPAPTATPGTTLVPMQTATGGEFLSPTGNISCEIDYHDVGLTQAYCQTWTPARSVIMKATGKYTTCTGQQCLGNPGDGTPTLAYGTATGIGPFRCESATTGVTCTADGKGFQISASGITPVTA
jgi:hypothetical protein